MIYHVNREYDKDKNSGLSKQELSQLMLRLSNDEAIIGKVPNLSESELEHLFDDWNTNKDDKISWIEFREGLNRWTWKLQDRTKLDQIVDTFFQ